jgi:two-component system nitrate/nitrite response regulator NarL
VWLLARVGDPAAALQQLRAGFACKIVLIATEGSPALSARCLAAGINGCLVVDMSTGALTQSLRLIMLGQEIFPAPAGVLPLAAPAPPARPGASRSLSDREGEILGKLLLGHSNKMIARELAISEATVKVHLKGLLRKLKARNRTQAAIWAMENGYAIPSTSVPQPASNAVS